MSQALDPNTSPDQALAAAEAAGGDAERLVKAWQDAGNAAAIAEVAEHGAGQARKAARRAVGVLKSRGITIPETKKKGASAAHRAVRTEAFMTAPDPALNVLFAIGSWPMGSRGKVGLVYLNDNIGVLNIRIAEIAPSKLGEEVKKLVGEHLKAFPIPLDFARARIHEARAKNGEGRLPLPLGWDSIAALVGDAPEKEPVHPFDELDVEVSSDHAAELVKKSGRLHSMPEFGRWLPSRESVQQMLVETGRTLAPGAQPSESEMREKLDAAIDAATDRYCSPQLRERLVQAMRDSALSVQARAGNDALKSVIATMTAIQNRGLITDPPHEVPFLRALFEKAVHVLMQQGGGKLQIPVARPAPGHDAPEAAATDVGTDEPPAKVE